ncbi:hypothetical protein [Methylobacterium sp. Leaf108]|uniref:hypothetical protein n=1 Tax=Methylobacterium sp. Leaf108 TaxID=1736256 RepID=UPI0012E96597|nr:hypothetical protein [Methylobacterium sp. Leaf108]
MTGTTDVTPVRVTVSGVDVVTIPAAHYVELLDCQRQLAAHKADKPAVLKPRRVQIDTRSRLFDDPEVTDFLLDIMGTMRLTEARQACISKFGEQRAPSRAAIGRFWQHRRGTR